MLFRSIHILYTVRHQGVVQRKVQLMVQLALAKPMMLSRGEINTERMAKVLLDEFRSGKLGKFTLEQPKEAEL